MRLVDEGTWLGTSDLTLDKLPVADPPVAAHNSLPGKSLTAPAGGGNTGARMPAIDDRWITQPSVEVRVRPGRRIRLSWVAIVATFVIGFALALAAIELL